MAKKPTKTAPVNVALATNYVHGFQGKVQVVHVCVHINFAKGTISLIDMNTENPTSVKPKQWVFANRELEYVAGWNDILDAMKSAIADAEKRIVEYNEFKESGMV